MSKPLKLSYSGISKYSQCGELFRLHYSERLRDRWTRSSLIFGGAIDKALNVLLETRDLAKSIAEFDKQWAFTWINKQYVAVKNNPEVVYADKDLDVDFVTLTKDDEDFILTFKAFKKDKKWGDISLEQRGRFNGYCWESLSKVAHIILNSYHSKVLPQFVSVDAIQFQSEMKNSEGDVVQQYLDFCATLHDGSVILFDNKTTSSLSYYSDDAPGMSQQLISYYYTNKKRFGLTGVGYVAMQKSLIKNKTRICHKCGEPSEESKAKTCDKEYPGKVIKKGQEVDAMIRCHGDWSVTMKPECAIKLIVNPVSEAAMDLVLSTFDDANYGIKNGIYQKNLNLCGNLYGKKCLYFDRCWKGTNGDELIQVEESEKKD